MTIPLVDLKAQYLLIKKEVDEAIVRVLYSGNYVMGTEVMLFEREWAEYCGAKYCVGVSSGTDALYLALKAIVGTDRKVFTTPFTFFATTQAIILSGNIPRFVDVENDGNIHLSDKRIGRFFVPVHLFGRPARIPKSPTKTVIEDSAQAHGTRLSGKIACFSFYPTKNLGAMGQAGAVVTNDVDIANNIREMRTYCERERFVHYGTTGNYRMDELQAAILRAKLPHVDEWNRARRSTASKYGMYLNDVNDVIHLPEDCPGHVYHIYAIRCENRDDLARYLQEHGIQTSVRYPLPMHLQPALKHLGYHIGDFPQAEAWAKENLSLPMYPELDTNQIEYVCDKIKKWVRRK